MATDCLRCEGDGLIACQGLVMYGEHAWCANEESSFYCTHCRKTYTKQQLPTIWYATLYCSEHDGWYGHPKTGDTKRGWSYCSQECINAVMPPHTPWNNSHCMAPDSSDCDTCNGLGYKEKDCTSCSATGRNGECYGCGGKGYVSDTKWCEHVYKEPHYWCEHSTSQLYKNEDQHDTDY